jgi:hypothetical protein
MDTLYRAHEIAAWFLIVSNAVVGAWALAAQYVPALRHRLLWYTTGVAQVSTIVVAVIGALIVNEGVELEAFHALYGFSTIFAVAILYSYRNSPFIADKLHLLYGCGGLFIAGLGIRALFLDGSAALDSSAVLDAFDTAVALLIS